MIFLTKQSTLSHFKVLGVLFTALLLHGCASSGNCSSADGASCSADATDGIGSPFSSTLGEGQSELTNPEVIAGGSDIYEVVASHDEVDSHDDDGSGGSGEDDPDTGGLIGDGVIVITVAEPCEPEDSNSGSGSSGGPQGFLTKFSPPSTGDQNDSSQTVCEHTNDGNWYAVNSSGTAYPAAKIPYSDYNDENYLNYMIETPADEGAYKRYALVYMEGAIIQDTGEAVELSSNYMVTGLTTKHLVLFADNGGDDIRFGLDFNSYDPMDNFSVEVKLPDRQTLSDSDSLSTITVEGVYEKQMKPSGNDIEPVASLFMLMEQYRLPLNVEIGFSSFFGTIHGVAAIVDEEMRILDFAPENLDYSLTHAATGDLSVVAEDNLGFFSVDYTMPFVACSGVSTLSLTYDEMLSYVGLPWVFVIGGQETFDQCS